MAIILDIESYAGDNENYNSYKAGKVDKRLKDPDKIAEAEIKNREKFALSPMTGKIIQLGLLVNIPDQDGGLDAEGIVVTEIGTVKHIEFNIIKCQTEKQLLTEFWTELSEMWMNGNEPLVTYNGRSFDVPYLLKRSLINGIERPTGLPFMDILNKYGRGHIDLFEKLNAYGEFSSLNEWSYLTGDCDAITDNDAYKIAEWYEHGEIDKIIDKNKMDLMKTYFLYNKMKSWF